MGTSHRMYLAVAALVAWIGLLIQLRLSIGMSPDAGFAICRMLAYFTVLTNLGVALFYTGRLLFPSAAWLARPAVAGWICFSITFVGFGYVTLLQDLYHLAGWTKVADTLMHYLTPALGLLYWLLFVSKRQLRWSHAPLWSVYVIAYGVYALVRGSLSGFYPYPFLDLDTLGGGRVAINLCGLLAAFLVGALVMILVDRRWPVTAQSKRTD